MVFITYNCYSNKQFVMNVNIRVYDTILHLIKPVNTYLLQIMIFFLSMIVYFTVLKCR